MKTISKFPLHVKLARHRQVSWPSSGFVDVTFGAPDNFVL